GVLGLMTVVEDALADAEHHRSMTPDQDGERRFVAVGDELAQQFGVGHLSGGWLAEPADKPHQRVVRATRHPAASPAQPSPLPYLPRAKRMLPTIFDFS